MQGILQSGSPGARPAVAFVVATHNRGAVLIDCLRRTLNCGLSARDFAIYIVDNASVDGTVELVQAFAAGHREHRIELISLTKNCGPVAKNAAIFRAIGGENRADIVVLLDDDAYPMPGSVPQMIRHFRDDPQLGAAVFDVALPDGSKEASAYPDVFIGAGTALRAAALRAIPRVEGERICAGLPRDFFMQAEEYDLSFRLLEGGWSVQRFWDMPLMHLKTPGARVGQRTTQLDVRNNLYLLARYVPEPLCHELAADWLARYWRMALERDARGRGSRSTGAGTHKQAFMRGAAQGLAEWGAKRAGGSLLSAETFERIFKWEAIERRLQKAVEQLGLRRVALGEWGKNIRAVHRAAHQLGLEVVAVVDDQLAGPGVEYRGLPVMTHAAMRETFPRVDALILTAISPVHAQRHAAALRRVSDALVIDLFSRRCQLMGSPRHADNSKVYGMAANKALSRH